MLKIALTVILRNGIQFSLYDTPIKRGVTIVWNAAVIQEQLQAIPQLRLHRRGKELILKIGKQCVLHCVSSLLVLLFSRLSGSQGI